MALTRNNRPSPPALCLHNLGTLRNGYEVRPGGARAAPPVQVLHLPQLPLQGEMALQDLRLQRSAVQRPDSRLSSLVRGLCDAVVERER